MMMRRVICVVSLILLSAATSFAAETIKELSLAEGHEGDNRIRAALYDTSRVGPVVFGRFEASFDPQALFVRKGNRMASEYYLDSSIDLADLFAQALRAESQAMGFRQSGSNAWDVSGTVRECYVESHQVYMGATLSYGYMDVEFSVVPPTGGAPRVVRVRLHSSYGAYKEQINREAAVREGIAHLLVEGAQEAVSRLNRELFKAPASAAMVRLAGTIRRPRANDLHMVGLSGAPLAAGSLLAMLPETEDEDERFDIIVAIGRTGSLDALPLLSKRYADEDEDCRWATLKAFDSIGGEQVRGLVRRLGLRDDFYPCEHLARRITGS